MQPNPASSRPFLQLRSVWLGTTRGRILMSVFGVALLGAIVIPGLLLRGMMSGSTPLSASALRSAAIGDTVTVTVLASGSPDSRGLRGTLLEPGSNTTYTKADTTLEIRLTPSTAVTMGTSADLRAGAVVQVTGTLAGRQTIDAAQVVVLTGFVQVS